MPDIPYRVTYRRSMDEQAFWDTWGPRLRELLTEEEWQQLGIDVRTVLRTQWWTYLQERVRGP